MATAVGVFTSAKPVSPICWHERRRSFSERCWADRSQLWRSLLPGNFKRSYGFDAPDRSITRMDHETLEDHLRKATRHSTARIPEERVFALGRDLARELAAAHAEAPPRHPSLEPADVPMVEGVPRLPGGGPGDEGEDIFRLGALLTSLALGRAAAPAWRLDGPPRPDLSTVRRRAILAGLASPRRSERYGSASDALAALESALAGGDAAEPSWP